MVVGRVSSDARLGYKHQKVQWLRRLIDRRQARDDAGVFVAEGFKLLEEGLNAGFVPDSVFVAPDTEHSSIQRAGKVGAPVYELQGGVIERVASTSTPQGVIAVFPFLDVPLAEIAMPALVLVDVRDPGNLGTIMRSAEAAGVGAVVGVDGTVDPYNPKVVRSSAGAIFHVPFVRNVSIGDLTAHLGAVGAVRIGTEMNAHATYDQCDLTRDVALFFGNEAQGLGDVLSMMDETVSIPMVGRSESLNVGVAASILSFELARQRRQAS